MKKWNTPEVIDVNINKTEDGYFNVGWEGPFNIVFGDRSAKPENPNRPEPQPEKPENPATPVDDDVTENNFSGQ